MTDARTEGGKPVRSCEVDGNRLTLLPEGPERLAAIIDLIETAQTHIDFYFYIFAPDDAGHQVRDALIDACRRGIAVTLLVDAFGCALTPDSFFAPLVLAGARFGRFGRRRTTRYLIRNHQKLAMADGRRAIIGGFNISTPYFATISSPRGWRDLGLDIEGPIVRDVQRWFVALAEWTLSEKQSFRALRRMVREWRPSAGGAIWLIGGPTRYLNSWARHVKHDFQSGQRLDMAAAYFSPGGGMMRRLRKLARRGSARIILPLHTDNSATIGAARHLYRRMIESGVRLSEFRPQMLHTKLLIVDETTYVGSANFDMRSLFINVELVLRVQDPDFASAARAVIDDLAVRSRRIDAARYRRLAGPLSRLRWWFFYLLVGVLDYTVTRRLNLRRARRD